MCECEGEREKLCVACVYGYALVLLVGQVILRMRCWEVTHKSWITVKLVIHILKFVINRTNSYQSLYSKFSVFWIQRSHRRFKTGEISIRNTNIRSFFFFIFCKWENSLTTKNIGKFFEFFLIIIILNAVDGPQPQPTSISVQCFSFESSSFSLGVEILHKYENEVQKCRGWDRWWK